MNPLEKALNLSEDISAIDADELAAQIMNSDLSNKEDNVARIAQALCIIGDYRFSGIGYSKEVSDLICNWLEKYYDETSECAEKLIDLMYKLTSSKSDDLVRKILNNTKDERLKSLLLEAFSYKGK